MTQEDSLRQLRIRLYRGEVIVLLGAGVSKAVAGTSAMSWLQVMHSAIDSLEDLGVSAVKRQAFLSLLSDVDQPLELLSVADSVEQFMQRRAGSVHFERWLERTFGVMTPSDPSLLEALNDLGAPWLTTNYDDLARSIPHRREIILWDQMRDFLRDLERNPSPSDSVLHLHGHWRRPESVIFSLRDYERFNNATEVREYERKLLSAYSILFVGCGGTVEDPHFRQTLDFLLRGSASLQRHYLLRQPSDPDYAHLYQRYGVEQITCPESATLASFVRGNLRASSDGTLRHPDEKPHRHAPVEVDSVEVRPAKGEIANSLGKISQAIDSPSTSPFRRRIMVEVLHRVAEEVEALRSGQYSWNVAKESNFLTRAAPLFESARQIYAVSVQGVSQFWYDSATRAAAREYVDRHPGNTHRLFVFDSVRAAHLYRMILDHHYRQYGNVFVCSGVAYDALVERHEWFREDRGSKRDFDFGLLEMPGNHGGEGEWVEAVLSSSALSFQPVPPGQEHTPERGIDRSKFVDTFSEWMQLDEGGRSPNDNVLRWHPSVHEDTSGWAALLSALFRGQQASVAHLVLFKGAATLDVLRRIKSDLETTLPAGVRPSRILLGQRELSEVNDPRLQTQIKTGQLPEYRYLLMMDLDDLQMLERYYRNSNHSDLRSDLYGDFDESIKKLLELQSAEEGDPDRSAALGGVVEMLAQTHMTRMDFSEVEDIARLAEDPAHYNF